MSLPVDFDMNRAIELGNLVDKAYEHFDFVKDNTNQGEDWEPLLAQRFESSSFIDIKANRKLRSQAKTYTINPNSILNYQEDGRQPLPFGFLTTEVAQAGNIAPGENLFIVFRGTRTPLEWFRNSEVKQTSFLDNFGSTTRGFNEIFKYLWNTINQKILDLQPNNIASVFITGHSLGGALATLCAAKVKDAFHNLNVQLYTFASPRVGDFNFANSFNGLQNLKHFRIANTEDIVTTVPLATSILEKSPPFPSRLGITEINSWATELFVATEVKTTLALITNNEIFQHVGTPVYFTYMPRDERDVSIGEIHNLENSYISGFYEFFNREEPAG